MKRLVYLRLVIGPKPPYVNVEASYYPNDVRDCDCNVLAGLKVAFELTVTDIMGS